MLSKYSQSDLQKMRDFGISEVLNDQQICGVDIPTDGELVTILNLSFCLCIYSFNVCALVYVVI